MGGSVLMQKHAPAWTPLTLAPVFALMRGLLSQASLHEDASLSMYNSTENHIYCEVVPNIWTVT